MLGRPSRLREITASLSDLVVDRFPISPGNGVIWSFTDNEGRQGVLRVTQGGDCFVLSSITGVEVTRIRTSAVLMVLPFVAAELTARWTLSRLWRVAARNRLDRDFEAADLEYLNLTCLSGLLRYGVVVAPRPERDQNEQEG